MTDVQTTRAERIVLILNRMYPDTDGDDILQTCGEVFREIIDDELDAEDDEKIVKRCVCALASLKKKRKQSEATLNMDPIFPFLFAIGAFVAMFYLF